ncbi:ATP-binding cassette domain-containing protein [Pseudoalteromonas sp. MMG010]|uniref:ATP-binding cassette domain-containing protein n=1 Tax=Pseudoalteromonas sp. MMG010 TaxID=2822685 RepID=UPI001FFD5778|nr:ATP-binding cassette domain-containing protein [Pseudoalteromonas sp. MMG010]
MILKLFKALEQFNLDINLDLYKAKIIGVFGPSGSGKSTLLRCISGLEKHQFVKIDNQVLSDVAIDKRGIALQLQACPLFPHLDVAGNLNFIFKHTKQQNTVSIAEVVNRLGLHDLLERKIDNLSGGEKQRVVFARTLLTGQKTILLDEPFSALDWQARYQTLKALIDFSIDYDIRFVIVSHSLKELVYCCDTLVQLQLGHVVNAGELSQVVKSLDKQTYTKYNIIHCESIQRVEQYNMYRMFLTNSEQSLVVSKATAELGKRLVIPSSGITIGLKHSGIYEFNTLVARLVEWEIHDNDCYLTLTVDGQDLYCQLPLIVWDKTPLSIGDDVLATVQLES